MLMKPILGLWNGIIKAVLYDLDRGKYQAKLSYWFVGFEKKMSTIEVKINWNAEWLFLVDAKLNSYW